MDDLYRDYILDHYKRPRNFGELEPHDLEALEHNPLCGDELGVHIRVKDDRIEDLRFHGHGCAISQASASIASEELKGMSLEEVAKLGADWMIELLGIPVSATRRKCALLNLKVVRGAVTGDHAWPRLSTPRYRFLAARSTEFLQSTGFAEPREEPHGHDRPHQDHQAQPDRRGRAGPAARPPGHLARGRERAVEDQGRARLDGRETAQGRWRSSNASRSRRGARTWAA